MALLKLNDVSSGLNYIEFRDKLYYNKYKYRVTFELCGSGLVWENSTVDEVTNRIEAYTNRGYTSTWRSRDTTVLERNKHALYRFTDWRNANSKHVVIRIESDNVSIFSNDLSILKSVNVVSAITQYSYTEAKITCPLGTKHFTREPKHKYRIYFKTVIVPRTTIHELNTVIKTSTDLFPSSSLVSWMKFATSRNFGNVYTNPGHYIDYDTESTISYLLLLFDNLLGKQYKLEKRPEQV